MLLTVENSKAKKVTGCAVTYRAAPGRMYGTCPTDCPLKPRGLATSELDGDYLQAVLTAVPRLGHAFTYTHFSPALWASEARASRYAGPSTVVNFSADSPEDLVRVRDVHAVPTTLAVPLDLARRWGDGDPDQWKVAYYGTQRIVRCPAEWLPGLTCHTCGGGQAPLCARPHRGFTIGFTAHGTSAAQVGQPVSGGCYAAGGNVALHWRRLAGERATRSDSDIVMDFARRLPDYTVLRHHVAGDFGRVQV